MKFVVFGFLFLTAIYASDAFAVNKANDDIKDQIMQTVSHLLEEARKAIDTLTKTGKIELRKGLKDAIAFVITIDTKVKLMNPTTDLGKILWNGVEKLVQDAEIYLQSELKKIDPPEVNDDIKDAILRQLSELLDEARKAIDTLTKTGKAELISGLQKTIAFVQDIERELTYLKPDTDLGKALLEGVQMLASQAETILKEELKKVPPM